MRNHDSFDQTYHSQDHQRDCKQKVGGDEQIGIRAGGGSAIVHAAVGGEDGKVEEELNSSLGFSEW